MLLFGLIIFAVSSIGLSLFIILDKRKTPKNGIAEKSSQDTTTNSATTQTILDTSAIIDGRIAEVAETGFVAGRLIVPRFVLAELQNIADSADSLRRVRGRRGLEVLNSLRQSGKVKLEVVDEDPAEIKAVDAKLVYLAKKYQLSIMTTDFNLNRVASVESVSILNINELAQALRPVVIPGETMTITVVAPGKAKHQGVGYLNDGTMIVVEDGNKLIGKTVEVVVTRSLQTLAGKMIFATMPANQAKLTKNPKTTSSKAKPTRAKVV